MVIPGHTEGVNPESRSHKLRSLLLWIPGPALSAVPE